MGLFVKHGKDCIAGEFNHVIGPHSMMMLMMGLSAAATSLPSSAAPASLVCVCVCVCVCVGVCVFDVCVFDVCVGVFDVCLGVFDVRWVFMHPNRWSAHVCLCNPPPPNTHTHTPSQPCLQLFGQLRESTDIGKQQGRLELLGKHVNFDVNFLALNDVLIDHPGVCVCVCVCVCVVVRGCVCCESVCCE